MERVGAGEVGTEEVETSKGRALPSALPVGLGAAVVTSRYSTDSSWTTEVCVTLMYLK
jgi:hypothetical protein